MDDRREDKTAHTGPLGRIDHTFADLSLIGQKSWRNIEDGVDVLERDVKARPVTQIANHDLCRAIFPRDIASLRVLNQSANLDPTFCERWYDEAGEFARGTDGKDCLC